MKPPGPAVASEAWLITVPVWGEWYRRRWLARGLPSILAALEYAKIQRFRFLIHTDETGEIYEALKGHEVFFRTVVHEDNIPRRLANLHRVSVQVASEGECVVLCNADMVLSREVFAAIGAQFKRGKKLVVCHTVRTVDSAPPLNSPARALLAWGWNNRHPWVEKSVYGRGTVAQPAVVIFDSGENVVAHCFTLQPFAFYKDREIGFTGLTTDELVDCFSRREVHIVQDADEMAIVEPSRENIWYVTHSQPLDSSVVAGFCPGYTSLMMCWQFSHQIVLRGERNNRAQEIADEILSQIDQDLKPNR